MPWLEIAATSARRGLCINNCTLFLNVISWLVWSLTRDLPGFTCTAGEILGITSPGFAEQDWGEGSLSPAGALVRGKLSLGALQCFYQDMVMCLKSLILLTWV